MTRQSSWAQKMSKKSILGQSYRDLKNGVAKLHCTRQVVQQLLPSKCRQIFGCLLLFRNPKFVLEYCILSLFRVYLYHSPRLDSTEGSSTDCTDILKIMKGWTTLTQILDFRRVINNQKSVGTGRAAAAAPLDKYSEEVRWGSDECQWNVRWTSNLNLSLPLVDVKLVQLFE